MWQNGMTYFIDDKIMITHKHCCHVQYVHSQICHIIEILYGFQN